MGLINIVIPTDAQIVEKLGSNLVRHGEGVLDQIDELHLYKHEGVVDNEHEHTTFVEYWLPVLVHRSAHVTLKRGATATGDTGKL